MYISIPRKTKKDKKIPLSLNWYRNAHHRESNEVKHLFEPVNCSLWENGIDQKIRITYDIKKKGKGRFDTMNFVSVIDKFFCDWLVNNSYLTDDDCTRVSLGGAEGTNGQSENICTAFIEII